MTVLVALRANRLLRGGCMVICVLGLLLEAMHLVSLCMIVIGTFAVPFPIRLVVVVTLLVIVTIAILRGMFRVLACFWRLLNIIMFVVLTVSLASFLC